MEKIIGHKKILDYFERAIKENRLSCAYCFCGPNQVGKRTLARYLASLILETKPEKLEISPDFYYLSREIDEKTGKLKKDISIKQARELLGRMSSKSWSGKRKIAIIDEAEFLNRSSGNAFLKALEEAEDTIYFLLAENENALLPTIRSRVQFFYFSPLNKTEIAEALRARGYDQETVDSAAGLSWGRIGRALELLDDEEKRNDYQKELTRWRQFISSPLYKRIAMVEDFLKETKEEKEQISRKLEIWKVIWREEILLRHLSGQGEKLNSYLPPSKTVGFMDCLDKATLSIRQNANVKIAMENLILKM